MNRLVALSAVAAFVAACASTPPPVRPPAPAPARPLPSWAQNITNDGTWVFLGAFSGRTLTFYSPSSVETYHGADLDPGYAFDRRLSVWVRYEFEAAGKGAPSKLIHEDINCDKSLITMDEVVDYSRHNMSGISKIAYSRQPGSGRASWTAVPPDTFARILLGRVCK